MADAEELQARLAGLFDKPRDGGAPSSPRSEVPSVASLRDEMRLARDTMTQALLKLPPSGADAAQNVVLPPAWPRIRDRIEMLLPIDPPRIEVAGLWTEASGYCDGFAGLAAGLSLVANFVKTRWDALEPRPAQDELTGDAARDAQVVARRLLEPLASQLSERLGVVARRVVLFQVGSGSPYTYESFLRGRQRESVEKALAEAEKTNAPQDEYKRLDALKKAKQAELELPEMQPWPSIKASAEGQAAALAQHADALKKAIAALAALRAALEERNGLAVASTTALAGLLSEIAAVVAELVPPKPQAAADEAGEAQNSGAAGDRPSGTVASREQAIATLIELSGFFRRAEPHSPMADVLEELGRRARLSWADLIAEVLPDAAQRDQVRERLGLPRKPAGG
jgi:type VI secretion system protein ImpA